MASIASTVHRNWEQLLDQRIDLIQFAMDQRNAALIAGAFAQDNSSTIDWTATFREQMKASMTGHNEDIMRDLEKRVLETNDQMKQDTDRIKQRMRELAEKGDQTDEQEWEDLLGEGVKQLNDSGTEHLDQLRSFGRKRVEDFPSRVRQTATQIFTAAFTAVYSFNINSVTWLQVAQDGTSSWYQQPQSKVQEFDNITQRYYDGSKRTVEGWFDTHLRNNGPLSHSRRHRHRRHHNNGGNNLEAIKDIASKLQCMGLDSFTIVRKGDSWALEIDSPV